MRFSMSSRMMTSVTPAGAEVLLRAGVDQRVASTTSIGRLKMSDEVSATSGTRADVRAA